MQECAATSHICAPANRQAAWAMPLPSAPELRAALEGGQPVQLQLFLPALHGIILPCPAAAVATAVPALPHRLLAVDGGEEDMQQLPGGGLVPQHGPLRALGLRSAGSTGEAGKAVRQSRQSRQAFRCGARA